MAVSSSVSIVPALFGATGTNHASTGCGAYASSRSRLTSTHHPLLVYHCQSVIRHRHEYDHLCASFLAHRSSTGGLVQVITKTPSPPPTLWMRTPLTTPRLLKPRAIPHDWRRSGSESWTSSAANRLTICPYGAVKLCCPLSRNVINAKVARLRGRPNSGTAPSPSKLRMRGA